MDWKQFPVGVAVGVVAGAVLGAGGAYMTLQERLAKVEAAVEYLQGGGQRAARGGTTSNVEGTAPGFEQRLLPVPTAPGQPAAVLYGPVDGVLYNPDSMLVASQSADLNVRDFTVRARFFNPENLNKPWSYGFGFRDTGGNDQLRLYVTSEGVWSLVLATPNSEGRASIRALASGKLAEYDLRPGRANLVRLTIKDQKGYLEANDRPVATFSVSARDQTGDVWVGAGFLSDGRQSVRFEGFNVWSVQ